MKHSRTIILLGTALAILGNAFAQQSPRIKSQFEDFKGDGYYWYRQDPEPVAPKIEPPKPPPPPAPASAAPVAAKPLSTEWMRSNLPKLLDKAIDEPTNENVANYMYATRVALDKSQNFSEKVKDVVATDPFLDENNRVPISQFGKLLFEKSLSAGQKEVMNFIGSKSGLWVFVDDPAKCNACAEYVNNIVVGTEKNLGVAGEYKFSLKIININTTEGKAAAKRLKLKVTPTTILVVPPNGFYIVSQGLMSRDQLFERLLIAGTSNGKIPKDLQEKSNPYNKGVLTPEELKITATSTNPSEVMKTFRESIKGK